jgi:hypothetical protein
VIDDFPPCDFVTGEDHFTTESPWTMGASQQQIWQVDEVMATRDGKENIIYKESLKWSHVFIEKGSQYMQEHQFFWSAISPEFARVI